MASEPSDGAILRETLADLRASLAEAEGSGKAAISREIRILLAEIRQVDPPSTDGSVADEVAARRSARAVADAPPARRPARGSRSGGR